MFHQINYIAIGCPTLCAFYVKDLGVVDADKSKQTKSQKGQGKNSKEKPLSPRHAGTTYAKKKKDGKTDTVTSASTNGSLAPSSRSKQTIKSRSFSDKQDHLSKVNFVFFLEKNKIKLSTIMY